MPLYLSSDQELLVDSARSFISEQAPVAQMRRLRDTEDATGFDRALWEQFASMGFAGVLAASESGGLALGHLEAGFIARELGRNLTPSPFVSTAVGAVTALKCAATTLRREWLAPIVSGDVIAALALD